jgi:predicted MFS family arabinose efflux permease
MVQLFPRLLEIGFTPDTAGLMMLASGLMALPGSYVCGVIDSKIGARKAACSSYLFGVIAMIANLTGTTAGVWVSLVCIGMVVGGAANWPASLCIEEFGDSFAEGYGFIQPVIQCVGAVGPAFFAVFYGMTGSYRIPYICGGVLMAIGLVFYLFACKPGFVKAEEAKYEAEGISSSTKEKAKTEIA